MSVGQKTAPRRALNELKTLYTLNPSFRDVIVEGRDDAAWIGWYLRQQNGSENVRVFAVDDRIDVPAELVRECHPEVNARGRVVAASREFSSWALSPPSMTCVIDSDFDVFERIDRKEGLLITDYAAMEVYALEPRPLGKFLAVSAKSTLEPTDLTALLKPAWAVMYALRYVMHKHSEGSKVPAKLADKVCSTAGEIVWDVQEMLRATSPSPSREAIQELLRFHAEYLAKVPDGLHGIRGHDVAPLLVRFLQLKNDLAEPDHVERLLRQAIELSDLDGFGLFSSLKNRVLD